MSASANVLEINALEELRGELNRFGGDAQESLNAAELEIRRTIEWLQERLSHWQNETRRRQVELDQAMVALKRCKASGYQDNQGHYYAPDCSAYEHALLQAKLRLQEAEAEVRNVQQWMRLMQQTVADYQSQAQRLNSLLRDDLPRATAMLDQKSAALRAYVSGGHPLDRSPVEVFEPASLAASEKTLVQINASNEQPQGITWSEHQAILKKIDGGETITLEEFERLRLPISDLKAGSTQEDIRWAIELLESQRYLAAMKGSQEARNLRDAILATLKATNYWRSFASSQSPEGHADDPERRG